MTQPKRYLTRMTLFVLAIAALSVGLVLPLQSAFLANPYINSVIVGTLLIGIIFVFRQVTQLKGEIEWVTSFQREEQPSAVADTPKLLAPMAALLADEKSVIIKLSALSARSMLDSIASRLDEGREISRYLIGLLIFLGLLGTFWGLLGTIGAISDTIAGMSVNTSDLDLMFDDLKQGLESPLSGMATAFSSSLFGLAGSVILGFLDLQSGQAQNRFYNELEEWLSTLSKLGRASSITGDGEGGSVSAYTTALLEQSADSLEKLERIITRSEEGRKDVSQALITLSEEMAKIGDQMMDGQKLMAKIAEGQGDMGSSFAKLSDAFSSNKVELDDASKEHLRNMDVHLKRLLEEESTGNEHLADVFRTEIKLLARTIAVALEGKNVKTQDKD